MPYAFLAELSGKEAAETTGNPQAALHFVEYLLSPVGQQHIQVAHFLPSPALVGGDAASVPHQLRPFLQGEYRCPG